MNKEHENENKEIIIGGIYEHHKKRNYKVLDIAENSETKEEMVVYQSLSGEKKVWARPKKMFLEKVEVDGKRIPRFQFIEEDKNDWQSKYLRALADYQNLLKQTMREKEEFGIFARIQFLHEILPVYDNLKISLKHFNGNTDQSSWVEGIKHVVKQFKVVLENMGVKEIKTVGEKFDHHTMEAVDSEETEDEKRDGIVAKEIKAGYRLNEKVVIPAKVVVYKIK